MSSEWDDLFAAAAGETNNDYAKQVIVVRHSLFSKTFGLNNWGRLLVFFASNRYRKVEET